MSRSPAVTASIATLLACTAAPAFAADYLTEVTSEVYQTTGTAREIATRASTCISQNLKPGTTDAQLIISTDLDGGIVVARSGISYPDGLMQWEVRGTFTFEAREGRFRIVQTSLERFNKQWGPIGKWTGAGWKKAEAAFSGSASRVAQCVMNAQQQRQDW